MEDCNLTRDPILDLFKAGTNQIVFSRMYLGSFLILYSSSEVTLTLSNNPKNLENLKQRKEFTAENSNDCTARK